MIGYLLVLILFYLLDFVFLIRERSFNKNNIFILSILLTFNVLIFINSFEWLSSKELFIASGRAYLLLPFIVICACYRFNYDLIIKLLKTQAIIIAIGCFTIPLQMLIGPISFFADISFRAEGIRYASLLGSATTIGTNGAYGLIIFLILKDKFKYKGIYYLNIFLIVFAMLVSLQKAAAVNLILVFMLYFLFRSRNTVGTLLNILLCFMLLFIVIITLYFLDNEYTNVILKSIGVKTLSDVGYIGPPILEDLITRITYLPKKVFLAHNFGCIEFLKGVGLSAFSGIVDIGRFPMAHNNYIDYLASGGIFYLLFMVILFIDIYIYTYKRRKQNEVYVVYMLLIVLLLINMFIGAGSLIPPINSIFYIIFFSYRNKLFFKELN